MHNHALGVELRAPIILCGKPTRDLVVLKVDCSNEEAERLARNVLNRINTNFGIFSFDVSDNTGNPFNPQKISLNLENIKNLCEINVT